MVVPLIAAGIAAAGSLGAARMGQLSNQKALDQAKDALREHYGRLDAIPVPVLQDLFLQSPELAGSLAPMLSQEQLTQLGPSTMQAVTTDPRFKQAQMDALSRLGEVSREGITPTEKLAMEQIRQRQARDSQGQQQAILQNLAQRGISGGGQEMALRAQAQQAAANQAAMQGMQLSAEQRSRALQALMQRGQLAGQLRSQEFGEQSDKARAADEIARWNAAMKAGVEQRRAQTLNEAKAQDLSAMQNIINQRASTANEMERYRKDRPFRQYQMEIAKTGLQTPYATSMADYAQQQGQSQSAMWGGIGKGLGQIGSAWAESDAEKTKQDREDARWDKYYGSRY